MNISLKVGWLQKGDTRRHTDTTEKIEKKQVKNPPKMRYV